MPPLSTVLEASEVAAIFANMERLEMMLIVGVTSV